MGRDFLGLEEYIDAKCIVPYLNSNMKDDLSSIEKDMVRSVMHLQDHLKEGKKYSYLIPNIYLKGDKHLLVTIAMGEEKSYETYQPYSSTYITLRLDKMVEVDEDRFSYKLNLETAKDYNDSVENFVRMKKYVNPDSKHQHTQLLFNHFETILKHYSHNLSEDELSKIDLSLFTSLSVDTLKELDLGDKTKALLKGYVATIL